MKGFKVMIKCIFYQIFIIPISMARTSKQKERQPMIYSPKMVSINKGSVISRAYYFDHIKRKKKGKNRIARASATHTSMQNQTRTYMIFSRKVRFIVIQYLISQNLTLQWVQQSKEVLDNVQAHELPIGQHRQVRETKQNVQFFQNQLKK